MTLREVYAGRTVLLTGHTGFKGSWLSLWLRQMGAKVIGLSIDPPTVPSLFELTNLASLVNDRRGDIRQAAVVEEAVRAARPDFVFHLAAQPLVRASYELPIETFETNVLGTVHVLEAVRRAARPCVVVIVTTDKCYQNQERIDGYRESDPLGGHDPYSTSKACAELVVASWRSSFFPIERIAQHGVKLASARAGNVIGGGDWGSERLMTDAIGALHAGRAIPVRNPNSVRPWQHVLEPLSGYLQLGARMSDAGGEVFGEAWNFGPDPGGMRTVRELVERTISAWGSGSWETTGSPDAPHETTLLTLSSDKARRTLGWHPLWSFEASVDRTVRWYRAWSEGAANLLDLSIADIAEYERQRAAKAAP